MLELRRTVAPPDGAGEAAAVVVIVGAGILTSMTHGRRIAKMAGLPGEPVFAQAGAMWRLLLAALVAASAVLVSSSQAGDLFRLWMAGVGAGFAAWGRLAGFGWYAGIGLVMAASAAVDAMLPPGGPAAVALRCGMLGLVLPAFALATNRRFLWFRPRLSR